MKGVTPDKFELVLMVDADTKVLPDAITYMVAAMANDITIMGLCGETRIANKLQSCTLKVKGWEILGCSYKTILFRGYGNSSV